MKKLTLYASLVAIITAPSAMAMEKEGGCIVDDAQLAGLLLEQEVLERELLQRQQKLNETQDATATILSYSSYQRRLLVRKLNGEIGDQAWSALGGSNLSLAQELLTVISQNSGNVEYVLTSPNTFRLEVGGFLNAMEYTF